MGFRPEKDLMHRVFEPLAVTARFWDSQIIDSPLTYNVTSQVAISLLHYQRLLPAELLCDGVDNDNRFSSHVDKSWISLQEPRAWLGLKNTYYSFPATGPRKIYSLGIHQANHSRFLVSDRERNHLSLLVSIQNRVAKIMSPVSCSNHLSTFPPPVLLY